MRELRSEVVNDRRVRLLVSQAGRHSVTIEVCSPNGAWQDISLQHDANIGLCEARAVYELRCAEQEARSFVLGK